MFADTARWVSTRHEHRGSRHDGRGSESDIGTPRLTVTIDPRRFDAVIFDLDGVITDTASIHEAAWRCLFDRYLAGRPDRDGEEHTPFTDEDYRHHLDGKPRYDGVTDFLRSRGIRLPWGRPSDSVDTETVCGLGNRKDRYFHERLDRDGVPVFGSTVTLIQRLRDAGTRTAVFSSSRNCQAVLDAAGLAGLFAVRVDGELAARLALPGKPDPAVLLEATRRLGADPARTVVVEDAEAGVEAGHRGGFALVIGVDRTGHATRLRQHGADLVVTDLSEVNVQHGIRRVAEMPDALASWPELAHALRDRPLAVFLDFDGTLSEIVADPSAATLVSGAGTVLRRLAQVCPVAVISGRDADDVRRRVGVEGIWYAGDHGFELIGPNGQRHEYTAARAALPAVHDAAAALRDRLANVPGVHIERKHFTVVAHYRDVPATRVDDVLSAVREIAARDGRLRVTLGRKIGELAPNVDWHKGHALRWLLRRVAQAEHTLPIYAGDDLTDEDAFDTVGADGLGIVVRHDECGDRRSGAHVAVGGPGQLRELLGRLADLLDRTHSVAP